MPTPVLAAFGFAAPWLMVGAAAVSIPLLILLYCLKLRRREFMVGSTFLWQRAVADLQANTPFQRIRPSWLLFLQLLALILMLLALGRPIWG
ncbi:MAG: BatA domain-containing protein, partial [Planctomycetota bacterium]